MGVGSTRLYYEVEKNKSIWGETMTQGPHMIITLLSIARKSALFHLQWRIQCRHTAVHIPTEWLIYGDFRQNNGIRYLCIEMFWFHSEKKRQNLKFLLLLFLFFGVSEKSFCKWCLFTIVYHHPSPRSAPKRRCLPKIIFHIIDSHYETFTAVSLVLCFTYNTNRFIYPRVLKLSTFINWLVTPKPNHNVHASTWNIYYSI